MDKLEELERYKEELLKLKEKAIDDINKVYVKKVKALKTYTPEEQIEIVFEELRDFRIAMLESFTDLSIVAGEASIEMEIRIDEEIENARSD